MPTDGQLEHILGNDKHIASTSRVRGAPDSSTELDIESSLYVFDDLPVHESRLDERVLDQAPEGHLAAGLGVDVPTGVADSFDAHLRHCE